MAGRLPRKAKAEAIKALRQVYVGRTGKSTPKGGREGGGTKKSRKVAKDVQQPSRRFPNRSGSSQTSRNRRDEAVEVDDEEVAREDALAGDEEPSDGISLGSSSSLSGDEEEDEEEDKKEEDGQGKKKKGRKVMKNLKQLSGRSKKRFSRIQTSRRRRDEAVKVDDEEVAREDALAGDEEPSNGISLSSSSSLSGDEEEDEKVEDERGKKKKSRKLAKNVKQPSGRSKKRFNRIQISRRRKDDEAVEVDDEEVAREDALAGDEEPSDGISLGSLSSSGDEDKEEDDGGVKKKSRKIAKNVKQPSGRSKRRFNRIQTSTRRRDEAVEVDDEEIAREDARAGDKEPSDGISLGSSSSGGEEEEDDDEDDSNEGSDEEEDDSNKESGEE